MRVEKPLDLAHFLLGTNLKLIDTLLEKGCLPNQAPIHINIEKKIALIVAYNTAWYNSEGEIIFYEDIYNKIKMP